jgi:putative DNA primase/helicase
MTVQFSAVNQAALQSWESTLREWLPSGKREGAEWVALNPTRADNKPGSFRVNTRTGQWADFATNDKGGDPVSLYAYLHGVSQIDAAKQLGDRFGVQAVNDNAPRHKRGKPSGEWRYITADGEHVSTVYRFDTPTGKEVIPYSLIDGKWQWKSLGKPRLLYGLPGVAQNPSATVLVVEGEKAADAAQAIFPNLAVVTWAGGGKAVKHADFAPLAGRKVVLWPDNDAPGFDAMREVQRTLAGIGCAVKFCAPPADATDGWDLADADPSTDWLAYLRGNLVDALPSPEATPEVTTEVTTEVTQPDEDERPFQVLGFDKGVYFYLAGGTQQITELTPSAHTKGNLMSLAPLNWWEREFPGRNGANWDGAADCLMRWCEARGVFSQSLVRGRGAWWDDERTVLHLGDRVMVGDQVMRPGQVSSRFIYEAGLPMRATTSNPLPAAEARKFLALMQMVAWERPIYPLLAAGWCMVAHIGGALRWRPHIWVVGRKGSGKSHVMASIIRPVLGDNCLFVVADSSEAGIRQSLGHDSLPVLFDEAEGEDSRANDRIQRVLSLVRQSSSETGGQITKGTVSGRAMSFSVRSAFAFSSINANLIQSSDRSRVTVLELNQEFSKHDFGDILAAEATLLTEKYIEGLYARALCMAAIIRQNAQTFAAAAAAVLGEQRAGDQIGTLLAGAYALHSDDLATVDDAKRWVERQDWVETRDEVHGQSDEQMLWGYLMQQRLRVQGLHSTQEIAVGECIDIVTYKATGDVAHEAAEKALLRAGFKVEDGQVYVSNTAPNIKAMLKETQWQSNWGRVLRRLPGAHSSAGTVYFGFKGSETRATAVKI